MGDILLEIKELSAGYDTRQGRIRAVDGVNLSLGRGEFMGIAGESGCGKSTLAYAIMNLLEDNGKIFDGEIIYSAKNMTGLSGREMNSIRWANISMVFQSAMNALNPVLRISEQLVDVVLAHKKNLPAEQARQRARRLLELVDIPPDRFHAYAHQLSGGMKQRVMIAMALILNPELIIMDEPTTALDVVVQRTIIEKIDQLRRKFKFSVIFITHDLSLLVEISDKLAIMYGGKIVELGPAEAIYLNPLHPYTVGLMRSFPPLTGPSKEFGGIPGKPPDFLNLPGGCNFHPRCSQCHSPCTRVRPKLVELEAGRFVSCHLYGRGSGAANG